MAKELTRQSFSKPYMLLMLIGFIFDVIGVVGISVDFFNNDIINYGWFLPIVGGSIITMIFSYKLSNSK